MASGALPLLAAGLLTLASACPSPQQLRALPRLEVLPGGDAVYKLDLGNGFEEIDLALRVEGPPSALAADGLRVQLWHGAQLRWQQALDGAALAALLVRGHSSPEALQYENLYLVVPRQLELQRLELLLLRDGSSVARAEVALTRFQQQGSYRLPVDGCWFVSAAHEFGSEHRRWYARGHFGWDLVRLDDAEGMAAGKQALGDYRAFDQPVLAPAAGVVVLARDDLRDNPPGVVGRLEDSNFVLLDHGHGEHSKLAHLRQGSLQVRVGERVLAGQPLARVGNSGRSDAPHLHLHFQRTQLDPGGQVGDEQPLPVALDDYLATSDRGVAVPVPRGWPRRGEFVCARAPTGGVGVGIGAPTATPGSAAAAPSR